MTPRRGSEPQQVHDTRPKTVEPTWKGVLTFPYRLCNPPPAVGKVRSCGVTPIYKVQLDDILDRKHLPPLGLKDFEEWLLYVEQSPENLYFILWLKEYTVKYSQWSQQSKPQRNGVGEYRVAWPGQSSTQLAMFYARAKQTFFTPNSDFELNVPADVLAPFHISNGSPHPDPAVFTEVACEARAMLKESLHRFVIAAYTNVGTQRVMCGIVAGIIISLAGSVAPIAVNFAEGHSRWLRLAALPGLWLGLTILIASLHGVCLGVYLFGDLRQLRKFELTRPPISRPLSRSRPTISPPLSAPPITPLTHPPLLTIPPPARAYIPPNNSLCRIESVGSQYSTSSSGSSCASDESSLEEGAIVISPAYYDDDPVEGPAISPITPDANANHFTFPMKRDSFDHDESGTNSFVNTASFIHPFDSHSDEDLVYNSPKPSPEECQRITAFDFDALPPRTREHPPPPPPAQAPVPAPVSVPARVPEEQNVIKIERDLPKSKFSPRALIARLQTRCNISKWRIEHRTVVSDPEKGKAPISPTDHQNPPLQNSSNFSHTRRRSYDNPELKVRTQFKLVKAVPAFASPLTRVLSPIVVRGQWEIVVRSTIIALVLSWVVLGSLLAVPVVHR